MEAGVALPLGFWMLTLHIEVLLKREFNRKKGVRITVLGCFQCKRCLKEFVKYFFIHLNI